MKIIKKYTFEQYDPSFNKLLNITKVKYNKEKFYQYSPSIQFKDDKIFLYQYKYSFVKYKYKKAKQRIKNFLNSITEIEYYHILRYFEKEYWAYIIYDEIDYNNFYKYQNANEYDIYKDKLFFYNLKLNLYSEPETPELYDSNLCAQYIDAMTTKEEIYFYIIINFNNNQKIRKDFPKFTKRCDKASIHSKYNKCKKYNYVIRIGIDPNNNNKVSSILNLTFEPVFTFYFYELTYFKELLEKQYNSKGDKNEF